MPDLAVVTVTFNSAQVLPTFLDRLKRQRTTVTWMLILVDNDSADGSAAIACSTQGLDKRIIRSPANVGFGAGSNLGIRAAAEAGCDAVLLLNNDTDFGPDTIQRLWDEFIGMAAPVLVPKIVSPTPIKPWYSGGRVRPWRGYRAELLADLGAFTRLLDDVPFVSGCCVLVRMSAFDRVGLFDENLFVYCEDIDLSIRLHAKAIPVAYAPSVRITHLVAQLTGGEDSEFSISQRMRNQAIIIRKHGSFWKQVSGIAYWQMWMTARLLVGRDRWQVFRLRQRHFLRGLRDHPQARVS